MATKNVTIRMDVELKKSAEKLFNELGLNMTTAITMFIKQAVREQRFPLPISLNVPNERTAAAIEEGRRLAKDPNAKFYSSMEELINDLESDEV